MAYSSLCFRVSAKGDDLSLHVLLPSLYLPGSMSKQGVRCVAAVSLSVSLG